MLNRAPTLLSMMASGVFFTGGFVPKKPLYCVNAKLCMVDSGIKASLFLPVNATREHEKIVMANNRNKENFFIIELYFMYGKTNHSI